MQPHTEQTSATTRPRTPSVAAQLGRDWRRHARPSWLDDWEPQPFELVDGSTEVVVMGKGPSLLLLPPMPGFKEAWVCCASALARKYRVVTFDLRWTFRDGPRWPQLVDDMTRIIDAHAPGDVALVGHSLGGALAQQWALAHPDRVHRLVLSSSFVRVFTPRGQKLSRYVAQPLVLGSQRLLPRALALALARRLSATGGWVFDARCDDAVLDLVRHCVRKTPVDAAQRMVKLAFEHDTTERLGEFGCPTLIVTGEIDSPFALQAGGWLAKGIRGAVHHVSPGAGHLHPLSSPGWLIGTIDRWVGDQSPSR